jgi:hypothetical protein
MVTRRKRKPYNERSDIDKIQSNWTKIRGLYDRGEWSGAVVRAATAAEIATNLAVREELQYTRDLDADFVDSLLKWANGIQGKFDHLLIPVTKGASNHSTLKQLKTDVGTVNTERNGIVHRGQFKNRRGATTTISKARDLILRLVDLYYDDFDLNEVS